jgi:hypothetical protein
VERRLALAYGDHVQPTITTANGTTTVTVALPPAPRDGAPA